MPAEFFYTSLIFFHEFSSNLPISFILENIKKNKCPEILNLAKLQLIETYHWGIFMEIWRENDLVHVVKLEKAVVALLGQNIP